MEALLTCPRSLNGKGAQIPARVLAHSPPAFLLLVLPPCPGTHCLLEVAPAFPATCCMTLLRLWLPSLGLSFLFHKCGGWNHLPGPLDSEPESMAIKKQNTDQSRSLADSCPGQPTREHNPCCCVCDPASPRPPTTCALWSWIGLLALTVRDLPHSGFPSPPSPTSAPNQIQYLLCP